jgi:hypothetical protein
VQLLPQEVEAVRKSRHQRKLVEAVSRFIAEVCSFVSYFYFQALRKQEDALLAGSSVEAFLNFELQ